MVENKGKKVKIDICPGNIQTMVKAFYPVSDKPPTQPTVKVIGSCNPSLNSTQSQLNSISTQTTELGDTTQLKLVYIMVISPPLRVRF